MSEEKPLHVQVAEALGCKPEFETTYSPTFWYCTCPPTFGPIWPHGDLQGVKAIRRYDKDWRFMGPFMEEHRISVYAFRDPRWFAHRSDAPRDESGLRERGGATILEAVCNLIVAYHKNSGQVFP